MRKIFYQRHCVVSDLGADESVAYMHGAEQPTAMISKKAEVSISLLSTDQGFTVLAAAGERPIQYQVFGVYGHRDNNVLPIGFNGQPVDRLTAN